MVGDNMIIVSQDKDVIVNFDNVENIWINNPLENNDGKFELRAESYSNNMVLGEYETEGRAKEVVEEIYMYKGIFELYKCSDASTQDIFDSKMLKENMIFDIYVMPEK